MGTDVRPSGAAGEILSGAEFLRMLRAVVEYRAPAKLDDPLKAAVEQIRGNPAFSQSRLLMRILDTLAVGGGEFRRAELGALDAATFALVISLIDSRAVGTRAEEDWTRAMEHAHAN
jgi:hypothetical protein